ncbi:hypothetical protein [Methanoculleus chikugoensis]|uniref:hypothetical protein n=1 Tax=Methanoculleus chikugoensis TaxID=118126 RepID=UPI001FB4980F|nr:hypothetical protein [Methanoculleus chikugoensis]
MPCLPEGIRRDRLHYPATGPPVRYEIPREVVAEAIVNAVAHRDYASNGSVQVMLFADRPHGPVPANPFLAEPTISTRELAERIASRRKGLSGRSGD